MNLPNRLTILRVLLIPVFVALFMINTPLSQVLAALTFIAASVTDWMDGWYARKHKQETDFGKLMDPMADKLLVMAALIALVAEGRAPWLAAMLILAREFVISGIRLVATAQGRVIAADLLGKYKTALQMVAIPMLILSPALGAWCAVGGELLLWVSVLLAIASCVHYIAQNREVFTK
jgi:CDP-diacylglycerol---glycerol-3-phosphate 3-phosphatidyltransferase